MKLLGQTAGIEEHKYWRIETGSEVEVIGRRNSPYMTETGRMDYRIKWYS